jgi:dsDNA-specific endonuclease/ATPase MutS2
MSKRNNTIESMPNNNVEQNDPMEEDLPDLTPLLDSISILSGSSSQIQTQLKSETLENLVNLPQSQVSNNSNAIYRMLIVNV